MTMFWLNSKTESFWRSYIFVRYPTWLRLNRFESCSLSLSKFSRIYLSSELSRSFLFNEDKETSSSSLTDEDSTAEKQRDHRHLRLQPQPTLTFRRRLRNYLSRRWCQRYSDSGRGESQKGHFQLRWSWCPPLVARFVLFFMQIEFKTKLRF